MLLLNLCMLVTMAMGKTGNSTLSTSRPSVVNVGALFTIDSVIGRSVKPALEAAIEDVNSDSSVLRGTKLNLISRDTNCTGFLRIIEGNNNPFIFNPSLYSSKKIKKSFSMLKNIHITLYFKFIHENSN